MTKNPPVRTEERGPPEPDLLWDCFTNWAEVLRELEDRKREHRPPGGKNES